MSLLSVVTKPIILTVVMLTVIMLSVIMLNVVMLNVIMLNVVAPIQLLFNRYEYYKKTLTWLNKLGRIRHLQMFTL